MKYALFFLLILSLTNCSTTNIRSSVEVATFYRSTSARRIETSTRFYVYTADRYTAYLRTYEGEHILLIIPETFKRRVTQFKSSWFTVKTFYDRYDKDGAEYYEAVLESEEGIVFSYNQISIPVIGRKFEAWIPR